MEKVILVDDADVAIGTADKLAAHRPPGQLHRALSVFVFGNSGRLLVQRRAVSKHHFRERWSNTCCTHPRPDESTLIAGRRRLKEEMGIDAHLKSAGVFTYRAEDLASGLVEHEIDHVLVGRCDDEPGPNLAEVGAWKWIDVELLRRDLRLTPGRYTPWLSPALAIAAPT
jgi:isopentenyl-diphosphate delta-isomerase